MLRKIKILILSTSVTWIVVVNGCSRAGVIDTGQGTADSHMPSTNRQQSFTKCEAVVYETRTDKINPEKSEQCWGLQKRLSEAAWNGDVNSIRTSLNEGANVNGSYYQVEPALFLAIYRGEARAVRYLLDEGADVNKVLNFGETPLKAAVRRNQLEILRVLLVHDADVCSDVIGDGTAFEIAREAGFATAGSLLVEHGAGNCNLDSLLYSWFY